MGLAGYTESEKVLDHLNVQKHLSCAGYSGQLTPVFCTQGKVLVSSGISGGVQEQTDLIRVICEPIHHPPRKRIPTRINPLSAGEKMLVESGRFLFQGFGSQSPLRLPRPSSWRLYNGCPQYCSKGEVVATKVGKERKVGEWLVIEFVVSPANKVFAKQEARSG